MGTMDDPSIEAQAIIDELRNSLEGLTVEDETVVAVHICSRARKYSKRLAFPPVAESQVGEQNDVHS